MKIVIALGGNALGSNVNEQKEKVKLTAEKIVPLIKEGHEIIITHGNGPQVGLINLAFLEGKKNNNKVCDMPFCECGAMSEGYIGYHLQNALKNELTKANINKNVVSLITQIEVDKNDSAFLNPTKPIGPFYTLEEITKLEYDFKEDAGRGYRRVIASPKPIKILEEKAISALAKDNIVIACGGGGIPVINNNGMYEGIDAVIDKDFASSLLARNIDYDCLLILTAVDNVKINFNKPNEVALGLIKVSEVEKYNTLGHFLSGSMKPKIEASLEFVKKSQKRMAIITSIENALDAINMKKGTIIVND